MSYGGAKQNVSKEKKVNHADRAVLDAWYRSKRERSILKENERYEWLALYFLDEGSIERGIKIKKYKISGKWLKLKKIHEK